MERIKILQNNFIDITNKLYYKLMDTLNKKDEIVTTDFNPFDEVTDNESTCVLTNKEQYINVRKRVDSTRALLNIFNVHTPNYGMSHLTDIKDNEIDALLLKTIIDPLNVSDSEKRQLTVRAYFYKKTLPESLLLIDELCIEYINYHKSQLMMVDVFEDDLKAFKADKSYGQSTLYLDKFARIVRAYNDCVRDDNILPIEFFTHYCNEERFVYDCFKSDELDGYFIGMKEETCALMTIYAIVYNVSIPSDYLLISKGTKTGLYYIKNLLNNIQHEVNGTEDKHLTLIK